MLANFKILFLLLFGLELLAQSDTSYYLPTIELSAQKFQITAVGESVKSIRLDRTNEYADVVRQLQNEQIAFVKHHGTGSLATISMRGGTAGQTLLSWNGIPLSSPMLGLLDLSQFNGMMADEINVNFGGGSGVWGSGAISGVVDMRTDIEFDPDSKALHFGVQYGSFNFKEAFLSGQLKLNKLSLAYKFNVLDSSNDFKWKHDDIPEYQALNNETKQYVASIQSAYRFNQNAYLDIQLWWQDYYKEIPPTLVQRSSAAHQKDNFIRSMLRYNYIQKSWKLSSKLAYFDEQINYNDGVQAEGLNSGFETYSLDIEFEKNLSENHRLIFNISDQYFTANAANYNQVESENRLGLSLSYNAQLHKFELVNNLRYQYVDNTDAPITGSLGAKFNVSNQLKLRAKISRNFRLPTLNDRYWVPGGNPDILPEQGWGQSVGMDWSAQFGAVNFNYSNSIYSRWIKDWILWSKTDNSLIWRPQNITKVWSRGVEQRIKLSTSFKDVEHALGLNFDLTSSTNEIALQQPQLAKGEQLWYTPRYQTNLHYSLGYKLFELNYQHFFNDGLNGVNEDVEAYHYANLVISWSPEQSMISKLFLELNNIWNSKYFLIERRPMPGINYRLGIHCTL